MVSLAVVKRLMTAGGQPLFVFNRLALGVPRAYVLYTIPYGFNYLVRRLVARWAERGAAAIDPVLNLECYSTGTGIARQNAPIPFGLFSSPCGDDAAAAVEPGAPLGVSATAAPRQSTRIVNLAYCYGDTIRLEITGQVAGAPAWVDVVIEGYLVSETTLALWRKSEGGEDARDS